MIDWYDKNQCHHNDPNGHDRTNGRIFKIAYGKPNPVPVNLSKAKDEDLVFDLLNKNIFISRHARRLLQERAATGKLNPQAPETARELLGIAPRKLQAKLTSS